MNLSVSLPAFRLLFVAGLVLVTTHRLPAPIQEVPESPTPAPEQRTKKAESKPKAAKSDPTTKATPERKRFAGTWSGIMPEVPWGNVSTELTVDQNETTMQWRDSGKTTALSAKATLTGNTLSARFPTGLTTAVWSISPSPDGATANVRLTAFMNDQTAVFQRQSGPGTAGATVTPAPQQSQTPTAKPVPNKPGFVYDPFDPSSKAQLDVRGRSPGTKVKDPRGRFFIVP